MFERYTQPARRSIIFARYEAIGFGSPMIEIEHLTEQVLPFAAAEEIRIEIEQRKMKRTRISTSVDLPLSRECQKALLSAEEESRRLKHNHIGNEHLLVGLLLEEQSLAAELLRKHGINPELARRRLNDPPASGSTPA